MAENNSPLIVELFYFLSENVIDLCICGLRWYIGFLLGNYFINNTQVLLDWILEITILDYCFNHLFMYISTKLFPENIQSPIMQKVFLKMILIWLISVVLNQSLLLLLFSQAIYVLFTIYSSVLYTLPIESLTLAYYFSSLWLLLPLFINGFLSVLSIIDMLFSSQYLPRFIQYRLIDRLLQEWGIQVRLDDPVMIEEQSCIEFIASNNIQYPGLNSEENYYYAILEKRYIHSQSHKYLEENLQDIRNFVALQYQKDPAKIFLHGLEVLLPLEWDDFLDLQMTVSASEQVEMFSAYLGHEQHGSWRFLSKTNPWIYKNSRNFDLHESIFLTKNLRFIITIWKALKQQYNAPEKQLLYKEKCDIFIKILARMNRLGNNFQDHQGDILGDLKFLFPNLITLIKIEPEYLILSETILINLLNSFIQSIWVKKLSKLKTEEILFLKNIWLNILNENYQYTEFHHLFAPYNLSMHHHNDFIIKMNILFGQKWSINDPHYIEVINHYFCLTDDNFSHSFLMKEFFLKTLESLEPENSEQSQFNIEDDNNLGLIPSMM